MTSSLYPPLIDLRDRLYSGAGLSDDEIVAIVESPHPDASIALDYLATLLRPTPQEASRLGERAGRAVLEGRDHLDAWAHMLGARTRRRVRALREAWDGRRGQTERAQNLHILRDTWDRVRDWALSWGEEPSDLEWARGCLTPLWRKVVEGWALDVRGDAEICLSEDWYLLGGALRRHAAALGILAEPAPTFLHQTHALLGPDGARLLEVRPEPLWFHRCGYDAWLWCDEAAPDALCAAAAAREMRGEGQLLDDGIREKVETARRIAAHLAPLDRALHGWLSAFLLKPGTNLAEEELGRLIQEAAP